MRTRAIFSVTTICALALFASLPTAVSANTTTATVTITGGSLSISVPTDAGNLGTHANTVEGSTISGELGDVQVTDARSAAAGSEWSASVISTAFTPSSGPTIGAADVGYAVGDVAQIGTATYVTHDRADLTGVVPVVVASAITGDNSATWNPTINVYIPGGTLPGVYSGIITHSVL
jgi:hypothetical protein